MEKGVDNFSPIVLIVGSLLLFLILLGFIILFVRKHIANIRANEEEVRKLQKQHSTQLLSNSIEVQEKEQARFAADLHDGLITELNLFLLANSRELKANAVDVLQNCITTARNISHSLSPPLIQDSALNELIEELVYSMDQNLNVTYTERILAPIQIEVNAKLQLYRVLQELLHNCIKHSAATECALTIRNTPTYLAISCSDNGKGFDISKTKLGLGLNNITTRIQIIGGISKFKSKIKKGTSFCALIPYDKL